MENYTLPRDVKVFGTRVPSFPLGIGESFDKLFNSLRDRKARSYFGLSRFTNDGAILYFALAEEVVPGEAEEYGGEIFVLEKGEYLTQSLKDWRQHTDLIKDIFGKILNDNRIDKARPCVEWYKSEEEMLCMVRLK